MLIVVGLALIAVGIVLLIVRRGQRDKLLEMASTETSTAGALADLAQVVGKELGETGSFVQTVEVKGVVKCEVPLASEIAKLPCVYYESTVGREYEETYWETHATTKQQMQHTRRGSETLASNQRGIPFWVDDGTGRILVDPQGASFDGLQGVERFEAAEGGGGGVLAFGNFSLDLGLFPLGGGRRTLGYRLREKMLPLERRVYVLGEAADASGELTIRAPHEKAKRFIVSLKDEEELIRSTGTTVTWLLYGAISCAILGVALIVAGLLGTTTPTP